VNRFHRSTRRSPGSPLPTTKYRASFCSVVGGRFTLCKALVGILICYNSPPPPTPARGQANRRLPPAWSNFLNTLEQWQRLGVFVLPFVCSRGNFALPYYSASDNLLCFHLRNELTYLCHVGNRSKTHVCWFCTQLMQGE
jgi:hypothetical protein